jgi:hypothetical protein
VGEGRTRPVTAGSHEWARLTRGLEVGESLTAGPHLSATGRKRKGWGRVGPAGWRAGPRGPQAHVRTR